MVVTAEAACVAYRARTGYPEAHLAHLVAYASHPRPKNGIAILRWWLKKLEWSEDGIDKGKGTEQ
jgi:hypothetical protein